MLVVSREKRPRKEISLSFADNHFILTCNMLMTGSDKSKTANNKQELHLINESAQIVFPSSSLASFIVFASGSGEWRKLQFSAEIFIVISISWRLRRPDVHTRVLIDFKTITMMAGNQWRWTLYSDFILSCAVSLLLMPTLRFPYLLRS